VMYGCDDFPKSQIIDNDRDVVLSFGSVPDMWLSSHESLDILRFSGVVTASHHTEFCVFRALSVCQCRPL